MRGVFRFLGTLLAGAGIAALLWTAVVWQWQDPFTYLYTRLQQRSLADDYARRLAEFRAQRASSRREIALAAQRYRRDLGRGEAIGRLRVPRLDLNSVLVNGTDRESLKRGPGRYAGARTDFTELRGDPPPAFMPGEGQLVYVAGHRTTYLAPFSHIDRLRKGDRVTLELPYATFEYRITGHRIVAASDLRMIEPRGREVLVLQACHPRFFATQRYLAYALPVRVEPRVGKPIELRAAGATRPRA